MQYLMKAAFIGLIGPPGRAARAPVAQPSGGDPGRAAEWKRRAGDHVPGGRLATFQLRSL